MAQGNGGIIGPVNTVNAAECVAAKVTTFTASGTFTAGATADVDYLVVAGGGGGGGSLGGGGGAGGYRASGCFTPSPTRGSAVPVVANTPYTITIGGGGAGIGAPCATQGGGTSGDNSIFNYNGASITSTGGGAGGGGPPGGGTQPGGAAGGSGGGSPGYGPPGGGAGSGNAGSFPISEGNAGGTSPPGGPPYGSGGGGGAGV